MDESNLLNTKTIINLKFKYNPTLFICDQLLRVVVLVLYIQYGFSAWIFVGLQILLFIALNYIKDNYDSSLIKKYYTFIAPKYSNVKPEIKIEENIPSKLTGYQALFGFIFSFWFLYDAFKNHAWYIYILIIILSLIGMVFCILPLVFSARYYTKKGAELATFIEEKLIKEGEEEKIVKYDVSPQYSNFFTKGIINEPDFIEFDSIDLNDTKIAKLESELKNLNYKADAWMLESVFLGGLAFSGFLTVASANILEKETETFRTFILHIFEYFTLCQKTQISEWYSNITGHFFRNDLYILIMLLCLSSSVFFLLILTLRLRLNSLTLNLDHILRILVIFNAKEEEIFNNQLDLENNPYQVARFEKIQKKIEIALTDAEKLLIKIRPVAIMMNIYRTIAIILFYIVLIISGFYFKPIIAVAIFSLAVFTFLFRKIETYINITEIRNRVKRH